MARLNVQRILIALLFSSVCHASGLPPVMGAVNPDVTQENIRSTICKKGWTKTVRPPTSYTNALKRQQLHDWDYPDANPDHYEEDHLIPLSLGGHPTSPINLWPQPRRAEWNAAKKNRLAALLSKKVCAGEMTLKDAQQQINYDWIDAYKRYFK